MVKAVVAATAACLVVMAALVAVEAVPGYHQRGRLYYNRPSYKRPSFYSQRQPDDSVSHGAVHSEAVSSPSSFDLASVGHDSHATISNDGSSLVSVGQDSHDGVNLASAGPDLLSTVDLRSNS